MSTELYASMNNLTIKENSTCEPHYDAGNGTGKFYVIVMGRRTGIFRSWEAARPFVAGVSNNQHKSFSTIVDAREYWDDYCRANHTHVPPQAVPSPYSTPQNLSPSSSPPTLPNQSIRLSNTPESGPQAMGSGQLFYIVRPVNPRSLGAAIYSNRATALAAFHNAGDGWELLVTGSLESAEVEIHRI
ncbi:hypothetical protein BD779DRAFT_1675491 [Infundibulicybe gibba]|nr:hypothetical protein BD779DRAFT_1675491 [Infundibulicybe gibba]